MDPEAEVKKQVNPFYCNICKIWCASALNLQTHFLGFKHKKVEEALKAHGIGLAARTLSDAICGQKKYLTGEEIAAELLKKVGRPWAESSALGGKRFNLVLVCVLVKTASGTGDQVKVPVKLPGYVQTKPERYHGQTLEEQLNTCKDSEPALGLNYIIEYRSKDNFPFLYECQLCHCKTGLSNMFMHVCGSKHRLAYLKQHYPEIAESDEVKGKGSELNRKVRQVALTIEKKEGRKQLKVVIEAPVIRKRWQEYPNADDSPSKAKVQHVDMSLNNEEGIDCKNKDGKLQDPIQEEKNDQEEQENCQKEQTIPDEKAETNEAVESTKGNLTEEGSSSEKCETNIQPQEENEEVEQASVAAAEEFTSQEELLSYLVVKQLAEQLSSVQLSKMCVVYAFTAGVQSFEILNEDDAAFILKVTQTLTDALVEYRQQAASKKDLLDNERNGEEALERSTEQSELTSADISDSDTDYSSSRSAKKSLSINEEDELQNFSTGSLDTAYENNITTEFLNSVRNMNVEEVTATLHKIAATNPAFRGMDIPNVVKILTESGTLRRPSNGSTH